jgi:hypothetical protein
MPLFLGSKDLNLKTEWRFGSINHDHCADTTPGVLYIGAGGALKPGVIDRRAPEAAGNTLTGIVFRKRDLVYNHLLSTWIHRSEEGKIPLSAKFTPTLILGPDPDFDAIAASFLAIRLLEKGEFPGYAEFLVNYVRNVTLGRYKLELANPDSLNALHVACLALRHLKGMDGRLLPPEAQVNRGIELLERVLSQIIMARSESKAGPIRRAEDMLPGSPGATAWTKDPWFADIKKLLDAEPAKFQRDLERTAKMEPVLLPAADGDGLIPVTAFVSASPMESAFIKNWAHGAGFPYVLQPSGNPRTNPDSSGADDPIYPRILISIDPGFESNGRRPDLCGLGRALERLETEYRKARNQGVDDRGGTTEGSYFRSDDPWHDGMDLGWTVVESPHSGTRIPYSRIIESAVKQPYWETPLCHAALALFWRDKSDAAGAGSQPVRRPPDISSTLDEFYAGCAAAPWALDTGQEPFPEGVTVACTTRFFPEKTCPPLKIVSLRADSRVSMESLLAARERMIRAAGGTPPDRMVAGLSFKNAPNPARTDGLLREMSGGDLQPLSESATGAAIFHNDRAVVVIDQSQDLPEGTDGSLELEVLVYLEFLEESARAFSGKIGNLAPRQERPLDPRAIEALRRDYLVFKTRYFRLEPVSTDRGRMVLRPMAALLKIPGQFNEVQSQLDDLNRLTPARPESGRMVQRLLYFVAAAVTLQLALTVVSLLSR